MAKIGFIGLGQMGSAMSRNLMKAGHDLSVFDVSEDAVAAAVGHGAAAAASPADAARGAMRYSRSSRSAKLSKRRCSVRTALPKV